mgnify:CR=1 FL=1
MLKTNVMRLLDNAQIEYRMYEYSVEDGLLDALSIARKIGEASEQVFKTLVTVGASKEHFVFVIPAGCELDLKKAAKSVGEKSIQMVKSKELLPLTGYIHGGCSPIGMKKFFTTTVHESAKNFGTIFFSGGKIGYQVEVSPEDLGKMIRFEYADLCE